MKTKRGSTVVELAMMCLVTILSIGAVIAFIRAADQTWSKSNAQQSTKEILARTAVKLAPYFRNGLRILPTSNASQVTVVWPLSDGAGGYVIPLTDGDRYTFYLSDTSGAMNAQGSILWKAKNGVPDKAWSLRSGYGAIDLGDSSLLFSYLPAGDPETIQITATATQTASRNPAVKGTATVLLLLRNHQAAKG